MTAPHLKAYLLLLLLAACTSSGPSVVGEGEIGKLYSREWELQSVILDGSHDVMHVDAKMTLNFAPGGQVAGFGAVNRIAGSYKLTPDGKLAWASLGIVGERKKQGPPELMEKELHFLEALRKTNMLIMGRHALVLQRDDGSTVLQFVEAGH
jgi:heat shock protein HslJ